MGQHEKDIADAKSIGTKWLMKDENYRRQLVAIRKTLVSAAKADLTSVSDAVARGGLDATQAEHLGTEVTVLIGKLDKFARQVKKLADEHHAWALREPRKDLEFIRTQLRLGPKTGDRYEAVAVALKNQLIDIGKKLAETDAARKDVAYQIGNQLTVAKRLQKQIEEGLAQGIAYLEQMRTQTKQFVDRATIDITELKVFATAGDLKALESGDIDDDGRERRLKQWRARLAAIPTIRQGLEKNYQRIMKTVPKHVRDSMQMGGIHATLDNHKVRFERELDEADERIKDIIAHLMAHNLKSRG